jgi:DNA-binding IclR family transcriptional regulator
MRTTWALRIPFNALEFCRMPKAVKPPLVETKRTVAAKRNKPVFSTTEALSQIPRDRNLVHALVRGIGIINAFGKNDVWLGNAEIAQRVGLAKPTVSRMTQTLTALGYLRYSADRREYRLGIAVLALGYSAQANIDVRKIARAKMQMLANDFNGIVGLVARDGFEILHLESCHSATNVISLRIDAEAVAPVVDTAFGHALLWAQPAKERSSLLEQLQAKSGTRWPSVRQSLDHAFAAIDRDGFCVSYGRWHRDVNTVGVPLRQRRGDPPLALGFTCLVGQRVRTQIQVEIAPRLVAVGRDIARELG